MKKILPLSYKPKIEPVRAYKIRQTIRKGDRYKVGDELMFHGWSGKPYRSPWGWRTPYMGVNTVLPLKVKQDGFELMVDDIIGNTLRFETKFYEWESHYGNKLAMMDGIPPPFGIELGRLLIEMHNLSEGEYPFQVLRWDKPVVQKGIVSVQWNEGVQLPDEVRK